MDSSPISRRATAFPRSANPSPSSAISSGTRHTPSGIPIRSSSISPSATRPTCRRPPTSMPFARRSSPGTKTGSPTRMYVPAAQEAAAGSLERLLGLPFLAGRHLAHHRRFRGDRDLHEDSGRPGDEVIYSLPPWFGYEGLTVEAGSRRSGPDRYGDLRPRRRRHRRGDHTPHARRDRQYAQQPDRAGSTAGNAATAWRQCWRRHPPATAGRIYLISDEPYNRIVFDGCPLPESARVLPLRAPRLLVREDAPLARAAHRRTSRLPPIDAPADREAHPGEPS